MEFLNIYSDTYGVEYAVGREDESLVACGGRGDLGGEHHSLGRANSFGNDADRVGR